MLPKRRILQTTDSWMRLPWNSLGRYASDVTVNTPIPEGAFRQIRHHLKCDQDFMDPIERLQKRFEVRKADRDFLVGDHLMLEGVVNARVSYYPQGAQQPQPFTADAKIYTGHKIECEITFILEGGQYGVAEGHVVLGIEALYSWKPEQLNGV